MPTVRTNDIDLYYEVAGAGPAVVFAHGAGGNHLSWWQQGVRMSSGYEAARRLRALIAVTRS